MSRTDSDGSVILTPATVKISLSGVDLTYFDSGYWWKLTGANGTHVLTHLSGPFYALHISVQFGNGGSNPPPTRTSDYSLALGWSSLTGFSVSGTLEDAMGDFDFGGSLTSATPPIGPVPCLTGQTSRAISYSITEWA